MPHWATGLLSTLFVGAIAAGFGVWGRVGVIAEQMAAARVQVQQLEDEKDRLQDWTGRLDERVKAAEAELRRMPRCQK